MDAIRYKKKKKTKKKQKKTVISQHGIGVPSLQILLNELFKLMYYAKMKNPVLFRIGTCGGVGITPGTVVITNEGVDEAMNPHFEQVYVTMAFNTILFICHS
jgi:uridine phosphorylase